MLRASSGGGLTGSSGAVAQAKTKRKTVGPNGSHKHSQERGTQSSKGGEIDFNSVHGMDSYTNTPIGSSETPSEVLL